MSKKLFLLLLTTLPLLVMAQDGGTQFFKGSFAEALAKAKSENKNVMVDCYTEWCGPCHYMTKNVFPNDTLGSYLNSRFVCLKLDMEHGEGPERQKEFKVRAYPTFIFFKSDGKEMARFEGMAMKDEFIKRCDRILNGQPTIDESKRKTAEGGRVASPEGTENAEENKIIDEGKGVQFVKGSETRFSDVLARAKAENKKVLVDFWAEWCHACKKMDATVLKDTRIGKLMNYMFVNYSVNIDEDPDGKSLIEKYEVKAFPTYLIINPDGTEYNRLVGSNTVMGFANAIAKALMGMEDRYVAMEKLQKKMIEEQRAKRKANLADTPKETPKTKVKLTGTANAEEAIIKAKKKGKRVMMYVCNDDFKSEYMPKFTFNEQETADYLKDYVCIYIDANSKQGDAILEKYGVDEYFPGTLLLDGDGTKKAYMPGMMRTAKEMKENIDRCFSQQP